MRSILISRSKRRLPSPLLLALRILIPLVPATLLFLGVLHTEGKAQWLLGLGSLFQLLIYVLTCGTQHSWREPIGLHMIALYLIAMGWLWLAAPHFADDWYLHFTQSVLLVVPLCVFALQTLTNSGASRMRRARLLAQKLAHRKDWPDDLSVCRDLPEVKAFRDALQVDATPAVELLQHRRLGVRLAALAALEFRAAWRPGQVEQVLRAAQASEEPAFRVAAINALANVDDRLLIEALANFLRDPSREVRRAASEALLWDPERRWSWVRLAFRQALSDPAYQHDGPFCPGGRQLPTEVLEDLNAWASEKGILAIRAAQTLGVHYTTALHEQTDPMLLQTLQQRVADAHTPPTLRIELATILKTWGTWDPAILEKLLEASNPASLRLFAAETLLKGTQNDRALATLHDVARLPNREIALATAEVVQRRLGVDLGLALGQPLPPLHSRQAAEVTRRVMVWAAQ